jgi:hypothetical protein
VVDRGQRRVGAPHGPEQQRGAELDVLQRQVAVVELVLHRGEHGLRRLRPVALRLGAGEQQRRHGPRAVVERQLREAGAELRVTGQHGGAGGLDAERGRHRAAGVEQPARDAQRVARLAVGARAHQLRQAEARIVRAQRRHRAAHHLAVERVGDPHGAVRARPLDGDQPARLDAGQRVQPDERLELGQPQRLAQREQLERPCLLRAELRQARADHPDERRAGPRPAREPPEALAILECALGQRPDQQLAHVEHVAAAALVHPAAGGALHRRAEHGLDEPARLRLPQRLELQPRH